MKTSDLLLSSLSITEDEYNYKGLFILSANDKSVNVDMADLENDSKVHELKRFFNLEEDAAAIRKTLMDMIMEKAHISSLIVEGEDYEDNPKRKNAEKQANSRDLT